MNFTKQQIEFQLACLYCGIIWEGTPDQAKASLESINTAERKRAGCADMTRLTTIEQQLALIGPKEARKARRKFRKLWRAAAKRFNVDPRDVHEDKRCAKRHFAYSEALRIYRARSCKKTLQTTEAEND
jgi:hypothetical protein